MVYITPSRPETLADRALYTQSHLVEVACQGCLARVMVRKNSEHHTAIQWTQQAVENCATFAALSQQDGGRPPNAGCPQLASSIEAAVRDGAVSIGAPHE